MRKFLQRYLLQSIILIAALWFVISNLANLEELSRALRQSTPGWMLASILLQLGLYLITAWVYKIAFNTLGIERRFTDLVPLTFAAVFINTTLPLSSAGNVAVFVEDARQRGGSVGKATAATFIAMITGMVSFVLVMGLGLVFLFIEHDLSVLEVAAALILFAFVLIWVGLLVIGAKRPENLRRILSFLQRRFNATVGRFGLNGFLLADDWATQNAEDFTAATASLTQKQGAFAVMFGLSVLIQLCDVGSLYAFLLAFNQSVSPTIAVAGFAVAGLFNLVSITPQGIGVVETVMSATLTALGIPATTAALVTLAYRGVSLWLPFFIGFVLMRRVKAFGTTERTRSGVWSVRAVALLTTLMGIINVLSAMTPGLSARLAQLDPVVPVQAQEGAHFAAIVLGGFLLLIGVNLWRRKRTAWLLAIGTLLLSAILHIIKGLDYEEATISLAIVTWLVILRHQFHALPDLPSVRRAMGVLLGAILFTLVYGTVGLFLLDRQYSVNFGLGEALAQVIRMFTQFEDGLVPQTRFGEYFAWSIYAVAVVTFAYALLLVFRAVIVRQPATEDERAQATDIVKQYGHTALTSYALLTDKSYFFSTRGSVIQYVPNNAVAVVLGDPIGPDNDFEASIIEFLAFCQRNGWVATFYQVQEAGLPVYEAHGFKHVAIGEEGSVDLHSFSLQGGAKKSLRSGTNKLQKSGYTAQVHQPLHEQALLDTLHEISDEWLTEMHGTEKRFSIGWFDDAYMQQGPIMAIHDSEGTVIAFANIISEYQLNESSIDLMRHRADVPNGIMDYLFVSLFLWSKEQGYDSFNLGLSALSGVGDEPEDPRAERALHYIYDHIDQFYNFKGLHNFKEKFDPIWTMRYLAYPGAASLPSIGLAMMRADSGDDWLWAYIRDLREALKQRRQNKAAQLSVSSGESKKLNEL